MLESDGAPVRGELMLWRAVIGMALNDATGKITAMNGWDWRRGAGGRLAREARRWFLEAGEDFQFVCRQAGFEPEFVKRRALAEMALSRIARRQAATRGEINAT